MILSTKSLLAYLMIARRNYFAFCINKNDVWWDDINVQDQYDLLKNKYDLLKSVLRSRGRNV